MTSELPPASHHASLCIELHAIFAQRVQIAKERSLPSRERENCHRRWHSYIDSYHTGLHLGAELTRCLSRFGKDGRSVAIFGAVDYLQRFVQGLGPNDRQNWTKDLLTGNAHRRLHIVEDGWPDEVAVRIATRILAAIARQLCAFLLANFDVVEDALLGFGVDDGTHYRTVLRAITNPHFICRFPERRHQWLGGLADRNYYARGDTPFARASE